VKGFEYALRNSSTDKMTLNFDLQGFSMAHIHPYTLKLGLNIMNFDNQFYPGRMSRINVINTPSFFPLIWKWVSRIILPSYRNIIHFDN
jgi:hypothetical protein